MNYLYVLIYFFHFRELCTRNDLTEIRVRAEAAVHSTAYWLGSKFLSDWDIVDGFKIARISGENEMGGDLPPLGEMGGGQSPSLSLY